MADNQQLSLSMLSLSLSPSNSEPSTHPTISEPSKPSPKPSMAAEPSKNNPSMAEPSENTSRFKFVKIDGKNSFSFQLGSKFKYAIAALSNVEFNEKGIAMIEVESKAVEITVRDNENKALGLLRLNAEGLENFVFRKPLKRKMINLNHISQYIHMASDDDIVTVWHVHESSKLFFKFGFQPVIKFGVDLLEMDAEFENVPNITYACECVILNEDLLKFLEHVEATTAKLVSVEVADNYVTVFVGKNGIKYDYDTKKGGIRGMKPGQRHHAWFQWPYCESLKKASFLVKGVLLCLATDPKDSIMWRFNLRELGDLVFIKAMTLFVPNFQ